MLISVLAKYSIEEKLKILDDSECKIVFVESGLKRSTIKAYL